MVVMDGYVRSTGCDSRCSRATQIYREQIAALVQSRGWRLGRMFDESSLGVALERIESRESDGLVVARVAHLGTTFAQVLDTIERIQAAQGRFVSVVDGLDLGTPSGRLVLRTLFSIGHPHHDGA